VRDTDKKNGFLSFRNYLFRLPGPLGLLSAEAEEGTLNASELEVSKTTLLDTICSQLQT
jgi:hypothetical protein